ncbi:Glycosyl hydrolase, family 47 [Phaffia rhodozyma]|uniref:alpha-1,2-Mannosidase n=1 Tax=Phaffia rhodozyma TaxID=264483 RepID=A0A0F7SFL2_PHARH|nr:Glycosyl hydrolase, family 47 [Phaffia rhodozyma]
MVHLAGWVYTVLLLLTPTASISIFTSDKKIQLRERTRELFNHGYYNYLDHGFPFDELKPLSCKGRGPNAADPANGAFNDVCGDYSLTLVDVIDTLAIMGNRTAFEQGVRTIIQTVSFDKSNKIQVFESTIRILGSLLSAHQFASGDIPLPKHHSSVDRAQDEDFKLDWYKGELLDMAVDLGDRLVKAWERSGTGFSVGKGRGKENMWGDLPFARVNLKKGVVKGETTATCTAGAGSLILEFATLSRLTGDPRYETQAKKAFFTIWERRSEVGLLGNGIDVGSLEWIPPLISHIGAGTDSFFEYALKAWILLGEQSYLDVFEESYGAIMRYVRGEEGFWFRGVSMHTGERIGLTVDSLAAFFPGLQVLAGDLNGAIKSHLAYWNLWRRYGGIPESFNVVEKKADDLGYPIRPEFVESNYFLYRATKDELYLEIGERILNDLISKAKVRCGIASVKNLITGELTDRMESFALSETIKYLYLLFDEDNFVNKDHSNMVFTTEGHLLYLDASRLLPPIRLNEKTDTKRSRLSHPESTCPVYRSPRLLYNPYSINSKRERADDYGIGLLGGIKGRSDYDFARHLAGLTINRAIRRQDLPFWNPHLMCETPKEEPYMIDVLFTADMGSSNEEDLQPNSEKLFKNDQGWILRNTTGVRAQVTKRLDGKGYDVTKIGHHRVKSGEKLFITDINLNKHYDDNQKQIDQAAEELALNRQNSLFGQGQSFSNALQIERNPTVQLKFYISNRSQKEAVGVARGGAATFGGLISPCLSSSFIFSDTTDPERIQPTKFNICSPPLPIHLASSYPLNLDLCSPIVSQIEDAHLLLVRRGGCTFLQKVLNAKAAGASGIIIWDPAGGEQIIQPSSLGEGEEEDESLLEGEVAIFLPEGRKMVNGLALEKKLLEIQAEANEGGSRSLLVEVLLDPEGVSGGEDIPKPSDRGSGSIEQDKKRTAQSQAAAVSEAIARRIKNLSSQSILSQEEDLSRVLWINDAPVRNTIVIGQDVLDRNRGG